jgi:transposase-like protein
MYQNQSEPRYYDRAFMTKLWLNGFHLTNDLKNLHQMANQICKYINLSKNAIKRLKWMDHYHKHKNVSLTCRHFDISRKTFYKWFNRYDPNNLFSLEDKSKAPHNVRQREITFLEEERVVAIRKKHIRYSKFKIAKIYQDIFHQKISSWKVQCVIEKYNMYYHPSKKAKTQRKRLKAKKKTKISVLKKQKKEGYLFCLDTIEIRRNNLKRYILTGIDHYSKVAFARMYDRGNSKNAADFLNRLLYLVKGKIENIQTDNGSEFHKDFEEAVEKLNLKHYWSRPRTPKDNAVCERFNRTLQEEFIDLGNYSSDVDKFNPNLTEWLIEYNFNRPHETLEYETPINFNKQVLPMYPSSTCYLPFLVFTIKLRYHIK